MPRGGAEVVVIDNLRFDLPLIRLRSGGADRVRISLGVRPDLREIVRDSQAVAEHVQPRLVFAEEVLADYKWKVAQGLVWRRQS